MVGSFPQSPHPQSGGLPKPLSYYIHDISRASRFLQKRTLSGTKKTGSDTGLGAGSKGSKVRNLQKNKKKRGWWCRFKAMKLGFGPSSASYLIAGKSRAKHRKSVQYIVTGLNTFQVPAGTCHSQPVLSSKGVNSVHGWPLGLIPSSGCEFTFPQGQQRRWL